MNKEIINIIKSTKTVDELKKLANINGYPLSDEEVKNYFDMYHTSGKISENELDNVAGGHYCRDLKFYSDDEPHNLIVTAFNSCDSFTDDRVDSSKAKVCPNCKNYYAHGASMYCKVRNFNNDPYNPA